MPATKQAVTRDGPMLNKTQRLLLIQPFISEDVLTTIREIDDNKAPRGDGFNAHFFKQAWLTMGYEVTEEVLQFFQTNKMFGSSNKVSLTLIQKLQHPSSIKEYRPISCFTTIYKIISNMLTHRLQGVMNYLVDPSQAEFVPGRMLNDNAILSHELVKI